ncbi:hypothetical protein [Thermoactinomyces mirandus]|uniref:Uncharacterized protein n=1 Tax=Thermoactinomyces mirandus TaxID=2756294 RepID=A0A7W2ASQ2_9BACL|nr:hypothetical protein [Thermoactinomyces mirandus]MBA4603848.1 hypothetical protein [Thermoactinomyces mirandus]
MPDAPPFKDFYDKSVVTVGENDQAALRKWNHEKGGASEAFTHWLIALVWIEDDGNSGWKVFVYPVSEDKPFWHSSPFYETRSLYPIDMALKLSKILEAHSRRDLLTACSFDKEFEQLTGVQTSYS